MAEGNGVDECVFIRGNPHLPGERVRRRSLQALGAAHLRPFTEGSGRLEFARCLTDPSNPLLARVFVNRVWLHLFGRGIVPTADDFGVLGQPPTHPELLDWLAHDFRTAGKWSVKGLIRNLVTTSAYRMSSRPENPVAEQQDPNNELFHWMPVRRLEGEVIRDAMLALSGREGGAAARPDRVCSAGVGRNHRFLILPWTRVGHLATWTLGRVLRRGSVDWQRKYGHGLALVERLWSRPVLRARPTGRPTGSR
jgi:hypothetical protein